MTNPPFDLDDYLARQGRIALLWSIEDVQAIRPNLTREEAMQVLRAVQENHDASAGVSWDTLRDAARDLHRKSSPPPSGD